MTCIEKLTKLLLEEATLIKLEDLEAALIDVDFDQDVLVPLCTRSSDGEVRPMMGVLRDHSASAETILSLFSRYSSGMRDMRELFGAEPETYTFCVAKVNSLILDMLFEASGYPA